MSGQENTRATGDARPDPNKTETKTRDRQKSSTFWIKSPQRLTLGIPKKHLNFCKSRKSGRPGSPTPWPCACCDWVTRKAAIEMLKGLVVTSGVCFRTDVPDVFLTNFATSRLMAHNVSGCISAGQTYATKRTSPHSGFVARFATGRRGSLYGRRSVGIGETRPAAPLKLACLPARSDAGRLLVGYAHGSPAQSRGERYSRFDDRPEA